MGLSHPLLKEEVISSGTVLVIAIETVRKLISPLRLKTDYPAWLENLAESSSRKTLEF